jgi:hypothetical protein
MSLPPVVLLVGRLTGYPQGIGDLLPTPAVIAGVGDVDHLQALTQSLQRADRSEPHGRCVKVLGEQTRRYPETAIFGYRRVCSA